MKPYHLPTIILCFLFSITTYAQSYSEQLSKLEQQKASAVASTDYKLAGEINDKIKELKANKPKFDTSSSTSSSLKEQILELEAQKAKAVEDANYKLAAELKAKITDMKANPARHQTQPSASDTQSSEIQKLEERKAAAVAAADYKLAGELKAKIAEMKTNSSKPQSNQQTAVGNDAEIKKLEDQKAAAVAAADYKLAGELKAKIAEMKNSSSKSQSNQQTAKGNEAEIKKLEDQKAAAVAAGNYRQAGEINLEIVKLKNQSKTKSSSASAPASSFASSSSSSNASIVSSGKASTRISKSGENEMAGINYRRSSLYSIFRTNTQQEQQQYAGAIQEAFVNSPIPTKFNDHNLSVRVIPPDAQLTNDIAKYIVAAWFNRDDKGRFDMELIKQRGLYNATSYDINVAQGSTRGLAILEDAGEELLSNTFVIINEIKYVSKEKAAKKAKKGLGILQAGASFIPGVGSAANTAISTATTVGSLTATIAGKGYWITNTTQLYQLVWNEAIANEFYTKYWVDENNYDPNKVAAFDNCNLFSLRHVGFEKSTADLQSSIFTSKSEEQLIAMATTKSIDKGIAKLERKFEQFRTKTPLYSVNPPTAKIGLKEGLEPGDKYEVLEQVQESGGKIRYVRKGVITVEKKQIWDNTYSAEELVEMGKQPDSGNQYTVFKGGRSNYAPGMLIRQIN